eukprot:4240962-Prymnesium_polylepis.1
MSPMLTSHTVSSDSDAASSAGASRLLAASSSPAARDREHLVAELALLHEHISRREEEWAHRAQHPRLEVRRVVELEDGQLRERRGEHVAQRLLAQRQGQLVDQLLLLHVDSQRALPEEAEVAADAHLELVRQLLLLDERRELLKLAREHLRHRVRLGHHRRRLADNVAEDGRAKDKRDEHVDLLAGRDGCQVAVADRRDGGERPVDARDVRPAQVVPRHVGLGPHPRLASQPRRAVAVLERLGRVGVDAIVRLGADPVEATREQVRHKASEQSRLQ